MAYRKVFPGSDFKRSHLDAALANPEQIYRHGPNDVIRDRRINNSKRLQILEAWEKLIQDGTLASGNDTLRQIAEVKRQIRQSP